MTQFVLVTGAWLGAWAWSDVVPHLRAAGHEVHPLVLSRGADEQGVAVGRQTQAQDIVDEVERLDLREAVLVGHSRAGIPVGRAAERIGDRLARVVFVDSDLPADGASFVSGRSDGRAAVEGVIAAHGGLWPPLTAADRAGQGLGEGQVARIAEGSTPPPGATLTEPATLTRPLGMLPATYVRCLLETPEPSPDVAQPLTGERWRTATIGTGHGPVFSRPRELARVLLDAAGTEG
ncbi:alpha/beta fold hydrolase [Streptomyces pratensis]|uniref:alpha/beta fold hydrolase n=1 Tax=Streptomyces pratensis TaxID=1169025 RepID=UPI003019DB0C